MDVNKEGWPKRVEYQPIIGQINSTVRLSLLCHLPLFGN